MDEATVTLKFDLTDESLFGNDAAEDEDDDVFGAYAVRRRELEHFSSPAVKLAAVSAYKGAGKSALLRMARADLDRRKYPVSPPIVISSRAGGHEPKLSEEDSYSEWVRMWKASLLAWVAGEIGARIGIAWSDDAMGLVELAETRGFRSRSFIGSIITRLRGG